MSKNFSPESVVPYNVIDAPCAAGLQEASAVLVEFATKPELPAVAIHNTGRNFRSAMDNVAPLLPEGMKISSGHAPIVLGARWWQSLPFAELASADNDFGWHTDNYPPPDKWMTLNYHFTGRGEVDARFIMAKQEVYTTDEEEAALDQGLVDPERLSTDCYNTTAKPGTLIVFKVGAPVVHKFVTLKSPRTSVVQFGRLTLPDKS